MGPMCAHGFLWGLVPCEAVHQAVHCLSSHVLGVDMALAVVVLCLMGSKMVRRGLETGYGTILLGSRRMLVSEGLAVVESLERVVGWGSPSVVSPRGMVCQREEE